MLKVLVDTGKLLRDAVDVEFKIRVCHGQVILKQQSVIRPKNR